MKGKQVQFDGVATVNFFADDLDKAKEWYSALFSLEPYFEIPGYIEFRIGDDSIELGIMDRKYSVGSSLTVPSGAIIYWQVADLESTVECLTKAGAKTHQPIKDRGNGFKTASFIDPFGNILGIMSNPHFMEVRGKRIQ